MNRTWFTKIKLPMFTTSQKMGRREKVKDYRRYHQVKTTDEVPLQMEGVMETHAMAVEEAVETAEEEELEGSSLRISF